MTDDENSLWIATRWTIRDSRGKLMGDKKVRVMQEGPPVLKIAANR